MLDVHTSGEIAVYLVSSQTTPGVFYRVDVLAETCTCPDFVCRRQGHPSGWLSLTPPDRYCKHLRYVLTMPVAALLSTLTGATETAAAAPATDAAPPPPPPLIEPETPCPGCGGPALPGEVYCAKTPYGRPWCARRALGALATGPATAVEPATTPTRRTEGLAALQNTDDRSWKDGTR